MGDPIKTGPQHKGMEGQPLTLTYFDLYGKAEAIRMLLTHSKTEFTDNRVTGESWAAFKASGKCANGQVPVLEVGDKALNQSHAILRFIGSQKGYYGPDPFDSHFADAVLDTTDDLGKKAPLSAEGKPMMYKMFSDEPIGADDLAKMLEARGAWWDTFGNLLGDRKYFGGASPSIADFALFANLCAWERNTKGRASQEHVYSAYNDAFAQRPLLVAWAELLTSEMKDYLDNRPGGSI